MDKKVKKRKKTNRPKVVVNLSGVTKSYTLHHEKPTFVESIMFGGKKEQFKALDNVNLKIYEGEKVGIIGHNGSGKTTILKLISQITSPSSGKVVTNGKVASLIELTAGFHPDLTGIENVFLNGLVVGMSRKEVTRKYKEIMKFAGIGEFINSPLYTYSDGMKLRLGFSIAIHSDPDILVLDEGIAAGDKDFQDRSGKKIKELFDQNKTIIIVSHWLTYLKEHCDKFILVEGGKIKEVGGQSVIDNYNKSF